MVPTRNSLSANLLGGCLLSIALAGCAGQVPPGGGPVDAVPPAIVYTVPDTNAVRVQNKSITLGFSEYVDRRSVEESIFISPYVGALEFDWNGKEVTVQFTEALRRNTTYVVSIGTDVRDIQAGNRMAAGFTLAFSTGDSIDRGLIRGRVFDDKPEGVMIFAYRLDGIMPDTLDPAHTKPDYITQTGKIGTFVLSNLAFGMYRVLAVRDEYRNLLYERQIDQYGVATGDCGVNITAPGKDDVWFRMSKEDTTRPFLSSVKPRDCRRIMVRFSEEIDSASFAAARFDIVDTLTGAAVPLWMAYQDRLQPSVATLFAAAPLDSPAAYRLRVRGVADLVGNIIDSTSRGEVFSGVLAPDTVRPAIGIRNMRDSLRGIATDVTLEVLFSDPVQRAPLNHGLWLQDSTRKPLDVRLLWTGPASIALLPRSPLAGKAWHTLRVSMDSVRSLLGRGYRDSTFVLRFQTLDLRTMGSLSGSVLDSWGGKGKGRVFITASSIDLSPARSSTLVLTQPGPFTFEGLVEGKYVIGCFRDADESGKFSFGLPQPFTPAERFAVYPDTVRVRARWGVEGVILRLN